MTARRLRFFDTECYPNFWLLKLLDDATNEIARFELREGVALDIPRLKHVIALSTIVGFNSTGYDIPMVTLALLGATNGELKSMNDAIITKGLKHWEVAREFGYIENLDHIDIMEVLPGVRIGLKMYGARAHSKQLQDLPYSPDTVLSRPQQINVDTYCDNDLFTTKDIYYAGADRVELRRKLGEKYRVDVRSKSDAQIAEVVIKSKLAFKPQPQHIPHGTTFRYTAPPYVQFATQQLRDVLSLVQSLDFLISDVDQLRAFAGEEVLDEFGEKIKTGVILPGALKDMRIHIGRTVYKPGIGGLHSQESQRYFKTIPGVQTLSDHDVTGYYPRLILSTGMFPPAIGPGFIPIFEEIVRARETAKAAGDKVTADGLKITVNGAFGKTGSKYSPLYAPQMLIHTTLHGQLSILMLIEMMELSGVSVISANTDGIVCCTPAGMEGARDAVLDWWQVQTGLNLEHAFYSALYSRDVNNYLALTDAGKWKAKGVFAESGVVNNKHPDKDICAEAVRAYLRDGVPLADTITGCKDIRKFIRVRQVKGGATYNGEYLGKAVRWYYAAGETRSIHYATNGNMVADSTGARPLMQLPDAMPHDVDYGAYIVDAVGMLRDLGLTG